MHVKQFLHKTLSNVIHLKRLSTLCELVSSVLKNKKLSVTGLGRGMDTKAKERSNVRRSDRLIGNKKFHEERVSIYEKIISLVIGLKTRPWVIVDWSHIPNSKEYLLRAAYVTQGRSLTIYEEVHPQSKQGNRKVHSKFLKNLASLLPKDCKPIVITDAGFLCPWFIELEKLGWDYVGRIRGSKCFKLDKEDIWQNYRDIVTKAIIIGKYLGKGLLGKSQKKSVHFYLVKNKKKGRKNLNKLGTKSQYKSDKEYSKSANEPWLLVSSLEEAAEKIIKIYSSRMQIEESFRDLKSSKYGFGFEDMHSKCAYRIENLLVVALLGMLIAWLTGLVAEKNEWQYEYQANSIKKKRILSLFFLGCRVIAKKVAIPISDFNWALKELSEGVYNV